MPIIEIKNLSKRYTIGKRASYGSLREEIMQALASPFRGKAAVEDSDNTVWALRDVSFSVEEGEVLGIIGRNGAGKSTLLKILSRITEPTEGRVVMRGRVASLLEVGTGFHPELTGRENIFLNGALLGMTSAEIRRKFDEIVAFSEIEKFLDTPVKRYSSGMYVRLAFAVAAHLEPEILIVDEVLAVGDAQFQKKCLGKMDEVAKWGRTVLFVSHNMAALQAFCTKGLVLDNGQIEIIGGIGEAIYRYSMHQRNIDAMSLKKGMRGVKVLNARISSDPDSAEFTSDSRLFADMVFYTEYFLKDSYLNLVIEDTEGRFMIHSRTDACNLRPSFEPGTHRVRVEIPRLGLRAGVYTLWFRLYINRGEILEMADSERIMLEVEGPQVGGALNVPCKWSWEIISA